MTLPNKLTVSRFVLTAALLWAMFARWPFNDTLALTFFCVAGLTDYLDGRLARQRGLITNFGVLMDPLADKILICSAFIALVERHMLVAPPVLFHLGAQPIGPRVQAWMVVLIVARELTITGLRLLAASRNVVLAAEGYGKHKTLSQMVAIVALLVMDASQEWGGPARSFFGGWVPWVALAALWWAVVLTVVSGVIYLWRNRQLYLRDV
ncbi:MAG: CDP-diacylglycerol--glycerol-3-phosphate 3-phosphatidyltransferase [Verrucomicrobiales bacterium]|nr:CDP-diacylglycerol--glycerol-3-phosphate 3-phosphatidyltransferase [Verrucomicrobiales bacterium]